MSRPSVIIAAVFVALMGAIGWAHWYANHQARLAIDRALEQSKQAGMPLSVQTVEIAPFAATVRLMGLKGEGGAVHFSASAVTLMPHLRDLLAGKPVTIADVHVENETLEIFQTLPALASQPPQTLDTTYTIAEQTAMGVDMVALGASLPGLLSLSNAHPRSLDEMKTLDFSALRALSAQHIHSTHLTVSSKTPTFRVSESIAASDIEGLVNGTIQLQTLDGLTETVAVGADSAVGPVSLTVTLRHATVTGFTIPPSGKDLIAATANLFGTKDMSLEDMTFASPSFALLSADPNPMITVAKLSLGDITRSQDSVTAGTFALDGVSFPLALLSAWRPSAIARDMGLKTVDVSLSLHASQDANGQNRQIGPISLDAKGLAGFKATMTVAGVGPAVPLETLMAGNAPTALAQQWANAAFKDLTLAIADHGLIHTLVERRAAASGQSVADLAASAPMIVAGSLATVVGETNAKAVGTALGGLIGGKTALSLHATTTNPIPFSAFGKLDTNPLPAGALTIDATAQ